MRKYPVNEIGKLFEAIRAAYDFFEVGERGLKPFFFPQVEDLMKFKTEGKNIEVFDIRSTPSDFVVWGAHACDAKSLEVLDNVFLSEPKDSYYASRREHGVIVTSACTVMKDSCFCSTFGIDASSPAGDVTTWQDDEFIFLKANSAKGEALLKKLGTLTQECDETAVEQIKADIKEKTKALPLYGLTTDGFGAGKTKTLFDDPKWAELSQSCLGCGTCTFVCPTCQCYDIKDFSDGKGVIRFRCWDSCMYSEFTKMSAGQPRLSQKERFRQRFMHKLVYYPENNNGMFSCVGCGRCLEKCPVHMNIAKVMKAVGGKKDE